MERIGVILNPHSRDNKKRPERADELRRIVGSAGEVRETRSTDDLRAVLAELLDAGVTYLVSTGGDGALNWILHEQRHLLGEQAPLLPIALTNSGTVDFVAKKVGIHGRAESIVLRLVKQLREGRPLDVIEIPSLIVEGTRRTAAGDEPFRRIGFAMAAGGVGQRFFDCFYRLPERTASGVALICLRASASYALARVPLPLPLTRRFRDLGERMFRPTEATVAIDGEELPDRVHGAIHAGAFTLALGALRVFPLAGNGGGLHFQAGGITPGEIILSTPQILAGGMMRSRRLREVSGNEMTVEAAGGELLAPVIDGEIFPDIERLTVRSGPPVPIARVPVEVRA